MNTWKAEKEALEKQLDGQQLSPETWDILRRKNAAERHKERVVTVEMAAIAEAERHLQSVLGDEYQASLGKVKSIAGTLCLLEVNGHGGPKNMGHQHGHGNTGSTRRARWASCFGRGRRQATDGEAWDAAIAEVGLKWYRDENLRGDLAVLLDSQEIDHTLVAQFRSMARRKIYESSNPECIVAYDAILSKCQEADQSEPQRWQELHLAELSYRPSKGCASVRLRLVDTATHLGVQNSLDYGVLERYSCKGDDERSLHDRFVDSLLPRQSTKVYSRFFEAAEKNLILCMRNGGDEFQFNVYLADGWFHLESLDRNIDVEGGIVRFRLLETDVRQVCGN